MKSKEAGAVLERWISAYVFRFYALSVIGDDMMTAVDKADSANFSCEESLSPGAWVLLNQPMDSRTGPGRFREFRIGHRSPTSTALRRRNAVPERCVSSFQAAVIDGV